MMILVNRLFGRIDADKPLDLNVGVINRNIEMKENKMIDLIGIFQKFEIIGEATKNISDNIRTLFPKIPWKEMAGMRDRLIHSYFGIDFQLVLTTIKKRIPETKPDIEKVLDQLD